MIERAAAARRTAPAVWLLVIGFLLTACLGDTPTPSALPTASASATASPTPDPTATPLPTATPIPHLALPPAGSSDPRAISHSVSVELEAGAAGRIVLTVTNLGTTVISELVLRWPTGLRETVVLAPFAPSEQRIRDGGPPLYQEWTKWVEGPGEQGEPAGTTSLGWGPVLVGGTLTIPLLATRVGPGPLEFDLQFLAGEELLTADGGPAQIVVSVP